MDNTHSLRLVYKSLLDTPHLMSHTAFDNVCAYLEKRQQSAVKAEVDEDNEGVEYEAKKKKKWKYYADTGVGIIDIEGALTYKPTGMEMLCGGASYTSILEQQMDLIEMGASTILLNIDSGGGEAYSMMETGKTMRRLADENDVRLLAYVDGVAASAAYGIGAAAHEIIMHPDAESGSIGVVVRLMNDSKMLEQQGVQRSFVYAGDNKIPFDADGEFRKDFINDIQTKVDVLYDKFVSYVATMRSVSEKDIRSTKASVFDAETSVKLGLADKVLNHEDFYSYLADVVEEQSKGKEMFGSDRFFRRNKKQEASCDASDVVETKGAEMADVDVLTVKLDASAIQAELSAVHAQVEELKAALQSKDAELASFIKQKKEAELAQRKASLEVAVGDKQAAELFDIVKDMSDAQFNTILASLGSKVDAECSAGDCKEQGFSAEAEVAESKTALQRMIDNKYPV